MARKTVGCIVYGSGEEPGQLYVSWSSSVRREEWIYDFFRSLWNYNPDNADEYGDEWSVLANKCSNRALT